MGICNQHIVNFHDKHVLLPSGKEEEIRSRSLSNRDRIKNGLQQNKHPQPKKFKRQGSFVMGTMIQKEGDDFDIDDGVYYDADKVAGMTALQVRKMIADAADDGRVIVENRAKCVRIKYRSEAVGYHVDDPIYRENADGTLEIAAADWEKSNPDKVTEWFNANAEVKGKEETKRIVRLLKTFVDLKSEKGVSGLVISTLVCEPECIITGDADDALRQAITCIYNRLWTNLTVQHPVIVGENLADESDARINRLRTWLKDAQDALSVLPECSEPDAVKAWGKVFPHPFFEALCKSVKEKISRDVELGKITPVAGGGVAISSHAGDKPPKAWGE